jgi:hypothetical protein
MAASVMSRMTFATKLSSLTRYNDQTPLAPGDGHSETMRNLVKLLCITAWSQEVMHLELMRSISSLIHAEVTTLRPLRKSARSRHVAPS